MHRSVTLAAIVLSTILGLLATVSCGPSCNGGNCAAPPRYDLILTEADSGTAAVAVGSTGAGVAFVLDSRRDRLTTTPSLNISRDDQLGEFPGKHVWGVLPVGVGNPTNTDGLFDVTATGGGMSPFTSHLVVGHPLGQPHYGFGENVGNIIVQQWKAGCGEPEPQPLAAPYFALIQDVHVSVLQSTQFAFKRRAYRLLQLPPTEMPAANPTEAAVGPCLPADFLRYPLVPAPHAISQTSFNLHTSDSQDRVFAFYKSNLNQFAWRVDSIAVWTIAFRRWDYGGHGRVGIESNGDVHVEYPSS